MRRIYEFRCESTQQVFERYIDEAETVIRCNCGANANRIVSAVRSSLDVVSGHFPGATMKWAKAREQKLKQERKDKANHGPLA